MPAGSELWRVYFRGGAYSGAWNVFRAFGPVGARFDHHLPPARVQERRILYAAASPLTCLAEVYQARRRIHARLGEPWLTGFTTTRRLRLLDLSGTWPTRIGASMAINTGSRARARRWSRALYDAFAEADGLWYASSMHANAPALALYERAEDALPRAPSFHRALADPLLRTLLENSAAELGYDLVLREGDADRQ